jgi:glycosyltransferase involved in cell wall biosynthesis
VSALRAPTRPKRAQLAPPLAACALIPTLDNPETVAAVVEETLERLPVILIDDGSGPTARKVIDSLVERHPSLRLLRHARNRGKGAALRWGLSAARQLGFTHALTLDADGQHSPADIPLVLRAASSNPRAIVLGGRDLRAAGAGWGSRSGRTLSNAWFHLATGQELADTQTGFRVYPLEPLAALDLCGERYELEVEVLAKAAWKSVPFVTIPVGVRYFPRGERVSHMGLTDFARISAAWLRLLLRQT